MKVALLTVSDSAAAGEKADLSGPLLHKLVAEGGRTVIRADIVPDKRESIAQWIRDVSDVWDVDLALTSGGTGLGPRDVTPEATRDVIDVEVPGIAEAIRAEGRAKTPRAMLSRGVAGVRGRTLVINLSGSPKAVTEQWAIIEPIVEHAVETIRGRGQHPEADRRREVAKVSQAPSIEEIRQRRRHAYKSQTDTLVGAPTFAKYRGQGEDGEK